MCLLLRIPVQTATKAGPQDLGASGPVLNAAACSRSHLDLSSLFEIQSPTSPSIFGANDGGSEKNIFGATSFSKSHLQLGKFRK